MRLFVFVVYAREFVDDGSVMVVAIFSTYRRTDLD
jgi:hypothetical protein